MESSIRLEFGFVDLVTQTDETATFGYLNHLTYYSYRVRGMIHTVLGIYPIKIVALVFFA